MTSILPLISRQFFDHSSAEDEVRLRDAIGLVRRLVGDNADGFSAALVQVALRAVETAILSDATLLQSAPTVTCPRRSGSTSAVP